MKRLLIVHRSPGFARAVTEKMTGAYIIRTVFDGMQALEELEDFRPHGLLLHTVLPRKDGLTVLEQTPHRPETVVVTTEYLDAHVHARLARLGADEVLLMPAASTAAAALTRLLEQDEVVFSLHGWLYSLGFRPGLTGWRQLCMAAELYKKDPGQCLSGEIYPRIGPPQGVEKAIRTAIHAAWREGERQVWKKYFSTDHCPGNKTFFAVLLQLYRDEAADDHGVLRDGTVHCQDFHTG